MTRFTVSTPISKCASKEAFRYWTNGIEVVQDKHDSERVYLTATDGHQMTIKPCIGKVDLGGARVVPAGVFPTTKTGESEISNGDGWTSSKGKHSPIMEDARFPSAQDVIPDLEAQCPSDFISVSFNAELLAKIQAGMGSKCVTILIAKEKPSDELNNGTYGANRAIPVIGNSIEHGELGAFGVLMPVKPHKENPVSHFATLAKGYRESRVEANKESHNPKD